MTDLETTERFVQQIAENQNRLYGYVYSLLGDHNRAADVLQETNVILWRKFGEFDTDRPFLPWAFGIARYQVLAHIRDQKRDRLLLDAELASLVSQEAERQSGALDEFRVALRACLESLTTKNREIVEQHYLRSRTISEIADSVDHTVSAIKVALMRSRRKLADCIQARLAAEIEQ